HEMGVLLLVFLPCLYCDASDAWTFRSRWRRAVVALAGVYFELVAALLAAVLWLVLAPGFAATLALYAAVIGSAMTVLVNLNPLLRFDGYYLLSDAWGVANLHSESRRALWGPLLRWVRGAGRDRQPFDAPRPLLALHAAASTGYVLMVMTVVLWAVHRGLDAIGFRFAGDLLVAAAVAGLAVRIGASVAGSLRAPGFAPQWRPPLRLACATAAAGLVAFVVLGIELEQSLRSPCRLKSDSASTVAAPAPGGLVRLVAYGSRVTEGDPIARIDDPQQEFALLEQREKAVALATQLDGLRTRAQRDPMLFSDVSLAETQLAEARRQTRTIERQRERRTLTASAAGVVGRPPERANRWGFDSFGGAETAAAWAGAPLD
ncbi:MAG: efflux RND transporter periplasmic adaptor subunit, partial [Planctomycetota bacterium]